jgi:hypothetical protein
MYRSLGGISPATPGYATVTIAPQISQTLGPNAVNASVLTVRGTVKSSWVRHEKLKDTLGECLLDMWVTVPVGSLASIAIPLLGLGSQDVSIVDQLAIARCGATINTPSAGCAQPLVPALHLLVMPRSSWRRRQASSISRCCGADMTGGGQGSEMMRLIGAEWQGL